MKIPVQAEPVARGVSSDRRPADHDQVQPQACWCMYNTWWCEVDRELHNTKYPC